MTASEPATLRRSGSAPIGQEIATTDVTVEIVFDPPRHTRLPINDDEIVDRALAAQTLAARQITILTYDTGQAMRARSAGLTTQKLTHPQGEEP